MKRDINTIISNILKLGVYLSSTLILIGIILGIVKGVETTSAVEPYTFTKMLDGLLILDYYSYLMFGIFVLILTPVLRVLGLLVVYLREKDYNFVFVCVIVLVILIISLGLGVTHN